MFGLEQVIDVGPMSGKSNVLFWLERHGIPATDDVVERVYARAKSSDHTLTEAEIRECVHAARVTCPVVVVNCRSVHDTTGPL